VQIKNIKNGVSSWKLVHHRVVDGAGAALRRLRASPFL